MAIITPFQGTCGISCLVRSVQSGMLKNSKGPELPAWVFLALRLGSLVVVAVVAALIARYTR